MTGNLRQDIKYLRQLCDMYPGRRFKEIMQIESQKLGWMATTGQQIISVMGGNGYAY